MIESETARQVENTRRRTATASDTEYPELGQRGQREELVVDRRKMVPGKLHNESSTRKQISTDKHRSTTTTQNNDNIMRRLATLTRLANQYPKNLESRQSADASHARQLIAAQLTTKSEVSTWH